MAVTALLAACVLAASSPGEVTLATPPWSAANVKPEVVRFWTSHLAQQITQLGPRVITQDEIAAMIGIERQRQLMGCANDGSSCMAELANALGSDGLIIGNVAHLGDEYQLNLKIVASSDGRTLAQFSSKVGAEEAVADELVRAARELTPAMLESLGLKAPVVRGGSRRWWSAVPAVLGVAGLAVGGWAMASANSDASQLRDPHTSLDLMSAQTLYQQGLDRQRLGVGSLITGGVLLAGAAVLFFVLDEPAAVAFAPGGHPVTFAFDGVHW